MNLLNFLDPEEFCLVDELSSEVSFVVSLTLCLESLICEYYPSSDYYELSE